jgi:hypothetical protein
MKQLKVLYNTGVPVNYAKCVSPLANFLPLGFATTHLPACTPSSTDLPPTEVCLIVLDIYAPHR